MIEIRPSHQRDATPNLTPLVDIVFQLLIFFMLTAFFIQPEGLGVKLPEAEGAPLPMQKELVVTVERSGALRIEDRPVELSELEAVASAKLASSPDKTVVVKADRDVVLNRVVAVMEACRKAGAAKLVIATESPAGAP
jgi:biopolymer transport protein ExbD